MTFPTKQIEKLAGKAIEESIFPGCCIGIVGVNGDSVILPFGTFTYDKGSKRVTKNTVYDIASITKAIPVSCLALALIDEKKLSLTDPLVRYVPEYVGSYRDKITLFHLLTQTLSFPFSLSTFISRKEVLENIFYANLSAKPGEQYEYSNSTSILLGLLLERATGRKLEQLTEEYFFTPLEMKNTTFHPVRFKDIVPTEVIGAKTLQGIVHDESARVLFQNGMIVGSAGLFSTCSDLLQFLQMLLGKGIINNRKYFSSSTIERMGSGLGWEINQPWMGTKHSQNAFGKTGFTGCFVFTDIARNVGIVLLSNHTYPKRRKDRSSINRFRSLLIDTVQQDLS